MQIAGVYEGAPLHVVRHMITNLPTEQRIFLIGQVSALILAFLFRYCLPPSQCGPKIRHGVASLLGICLSIYCFGWLTVFLIGEVILCYLMLLMVDPRRIHIILIIIIISFISHTYSSILSRSPPGILPYFSYMLGFLGLLAGPLCSFNDYQIFIHGEEKKRNPNVVVCKKLCLCTVLLAAHIMLSDRFSISSDPHRSLIGHFLDIYFTAACRRPKYYFAWTLADAINNAAGFGFNGISEDGEEKWDRLSNLNILRIETATSFKMFIDNWNIQTAVWLKEVCYDRSPFYPLLSTFLLSAAWHGVNPGYYLTFITAVPITLAARRVRQTVRPWFQSTSWSTSVYSVITWVCTQIAMSYTVAPFLLLELGPSLQLYRSLGFSLHILPFLLLLVLPQRNRLQAVKDCDRNYNYLKKKM
ncbi:membrane-bound glycerophospholipid O-acyltransferase 1-like [Mixophyes fleayi]|uniref:membrane-bound glycerophospholipid O-acyltransferase 1-like n=1 Tax=Mixophyes fleayi TaxID=3061075 RepID=UPI003F4D8522